MKLLLDKKDVLMSGNVLAGFELDYNFENGQTAPAFVSESESQMLDRLRKEPALAAELLSYEGPIIYMGEGAQAKDANGQTLGMRFRDGGSSVEGDNVYGKFLMKVRNLYAHELREGRVEERMIRPRQIVMDYIPAGEQASWTELAEGEGRRFIHTERYRPVRWRFDASRDGTTGHAQRDSAPEVAFQTFECPFGTDTRSRVRVSSAAEASLLYERGLRREVDWNKLFDDLTRRGLVKNMDRYQKEQLIGDLRAQFDWMREQICRNPELANTPIVSSGMLVPDGSFGRSIYDPETAPSPAHILARYINNPLLLFSPSENGVLRALDIQEKDEPYRFSAVNTLERVTLVIDGSDTIGGRVPGTRAVRESRPVYVRDNRGRIKYDRFNKPVVDHMDDAYKFQFKADDEIEADYAAFKSRLTSILVNISSDVEVQFVTGTGVGVPQMVRRYVEESGGRIYSWDYNRKAVINEGKEIAEPSRLSQLRMSHFDEVVPVLLKRENAVTLNIGGDDEENEVVFSREDGIQPHGWATFSISADARNRTILERGGLASASGLPVIHVQENATEEEQAAILLTEAARNRDIFLGERQFDVSLFGGELREDWDLNSCIVMSYSENGLSIPHIAFLQDACVYVNSIGYHSVYSAYAAMLLRESGVTDIRVFRDLLAREESMADVAAAIRNVQADDAVKERCMRNAVHLMAQSSSVFASSLISQGTADIACVSTYGDPSLFVDSDGKGQNRFGVVLAAERDALLASIEAERKRSEDAARHIAEENVRRQKRANTVRAKGQKMSGGFPGSIEEAEDAVWFLGTDRPSQLCLKDGASSFMQWEERDYGQDALTRELASRARLDDGEGGYVNNDFIFLFPSDELAVTGRRHVVNNPDAKDLTGVVRINPRTGQEFVCAFGIPVKKDNLYFEFDNMFNRPTSFRTDRESSSLASAIISTDALARTTALQQGMALCYSVRERSLPGNEENDDLTRVFMDQIWDYPRTREVIDRKTGRTVEEAGSVLPVEVNKRVYNRELQRYELVKEERYRKTWVNSPHAAPKLRALVKRYEKMLIEGADFPLNCICLPYTDYTGISEEKFLADFTFALSMSNALAIATDKPMRFPLDENGRLWLGPDVPEAFRDLAERKLDSFIGVVREENIINDALPYIRRIPLEKSVRQNLPLKGDGSDLYVRPNDLMKAFGPYDYNAVLSGQVVPIHEMAFTLDDGTLFRVTDPRLTNKMQTGEINSYLRYDKNDVCRFTIKSSDPDRIPEFLTAFKSYLERAKRVTVETRLLSEEDAKAYNKDGEGMSLDGFINLLSSNSDSMAVEDQDVSARGTATAVELPNRFDGTDNDTPYYGKEDARDAFAGYAQYRYTLPDGSQSDWVTITDREVALDVIYSSINRVYRSDVRVVPTRQVLRDEITSLAIEHAGEKFRSLSQQKEQVVVDTKVVESERFVPEKAAAEVAVSDESKGTGRVFVTYYASRGVPEDAFKVQISSSCPEFMKDDMDVCFQSLYPDYKTMVGPHKNGEIDDAEYTRRYQTQVLEPNSEKILSGMRTIIDTAKEEGKDVYLYCYCKPGAFCHRYLVNNFLVKNGIPCQENPADRKLYEKGHVVLAGEGPAGWARYAKGDGFELSTKGDVLGRKYSALIAKFEPGTVLRIGGEDIDVGGRTVEDVYQNDIKRSGKGLPPAKESVVFKDGLSKDEQADHTYFGGYLPLWKEWAKQHPVDVENLRKASVGKQLTDQFANSAVSQARAWYDILSGNDFEEMALVSFAPTVFTLGEKAAEKPVTAEQPLLSFTRSSGGYAQRTQENASADDVDFTIAMAVDFTTRGEMLTKECAGDSYIGVDLPKKDGKLDLSRKGVVKAVQQIVNMLPEEFVKGEPFGVNLAGNGMYSLKDFGSQEDFDVFVAAVALEMKERGLNVRSWRSGGQTGIDESVVAAGKATDVPVTVHAPSKWEYRDAAGKNAKGSEAVFKERFNKDFAAVKAKAEKYLSKASKNKTVQVKHS